MSASSLLSRTSTVECLFSLIIHQSITTIFSAGILSENSKHSIIFVDTNFLHVYDGELHFL